MTFVPHLRLSMTGTMPGAEIWSCSLAMTFGNGTISGGILNLGPDDTQFTDLADDCRDWFTRPATGISDEAKLKRVKIAFIGADGLYTRAPVERAYDVGGGATIFDNPSRKPNQIARAVTLHTGADLGRVKGRFYVPSPRLEVMNDGRWSEAAVNAAEVSDKQLLTDLNNEPGLDILGLRVVVASQGRSRNGVPVLAPGNHQVTAVSVGRVPDTIRRRRNKLAEAKTILAL